MPQTELCHPCHINRLAMMQSSQYSTYDGFWKEQLEYVYEHCSVTGPTEIPPPLLPPQPEPEPYCLTGQWYTTQAGNTCESIANATSVSGASLYMGNQDLIKNCLDIDAGVEVCIPLTCQTYYVQPSDTCVTIELAKGIGLGSLMKYNSWIDAACTNLQQATEFYGKVICLGPAGGEWTGTSPETPTGPQPNDGYSDDVTPPPDGAVVAGGTTLNCGKWHVVGGEDSCPSICLEEGITAALFRMVNPSLDPEACTETLQVGTALCVGPTYRWNSTESTEPSTTITLDPTATETSSSTSSTAPAITTPTPIQPGMVDNCNAFYFVTSGQGCAEAASINGISLADFYTWNPAVGSTCGGLWAEVYVCVGVTGTTPTTPTPTSPGNGISTPTPTLPGMVDNCNVFHMVVSGDGCWDLANSAGISLADFYAWNPQAAPDCAGLWLDYYVCLGRL
jgi:LysM repeat protein